jgi:hypothetical protein
MTERIKTGRVLWREDDATTWDPDHEDLKAAWFRLFGTNFDVVTAPEPELTKDIRDFGDECWIFFKDGVTVCSSYPGNNIIYAAPDVIPEGMTRYAFVQVDQEPQIAFMAEDKVVEFLKTKRLQRWRCRTNTLRVWSAQDCGFATSRENRPQHASRWRVLGGVYPGPLGDLYIFGEDNQSIEDVDLYAVMEQLKRKPDERVMDELRFWYLGRPEKDADLLNLSLAAAAEYWIKANP